jgi:2-oxo-4-hydroxy-4-carboxy--5-ureidoimidazoline (OHCU) decarboxylase
MSLRKKLREQATSQLDGLVEKLQERATELTEGIDQMWGTDLLKLAAGGRTDTIKDKLVTRLTNHKEMELEAFFNKQQDLPIEAPAEEPPAKGKQK